MAIGTIVGSAYTDTADSTTRICTIPTGTADGDILCAYAVLSQDDSAATAITVNTGTWAQTPFAQTGVTIGLTSVLIKTWHTGDAVTYTFGKTGSATVGAFGVVMIKLPGASPTPTVTAVKTDQAATSTLITCPSVVVPSASSNSCVVRFFHTYYYLVAKAGTSTLTPPPGFTEYCDQSDAWISMGAATLLRGVGTEAAANATASGSVAGSIGRGITLVFGPSSTTYIKTVDAVAVGAGSGSKTVLHVKTGGAVAKMAASGPKAVQLTVYVKTGGAAAKTAASGPKAVQLTVYVKTGGAVPAGVASGPKYLVLTIYVKSGSGLGHQQCSGPRTIAHGKTGSGLAHQQGVGHEMSIRFKTGSGLGHQQGIGHAMAIMPRTGSGLARGATHGPETTIHFVDMLGAPTLPGTEMFVAPYVEPDHRGLRFIARRILDGVVVDWELPILHPEITFTLSGPTLIKGTIAPENLAIVEEKIDAWSTWIDVEADGQIRASGICQPVAITGETFSLEALGVSAYPTGMLYTAALSQVKIDALDVVRNIWAHLMSFPDASPLNVVTSTNLCGILLGTAPTQQTDASGNPRTDASGNPMMDPAKPYEISWYKNIDCGREIDSLAKAVPFDYVETCSWNAGQTAVNHGIELGYPRAGRLRTDLRFVQDENLLAAFVIREQPGTYASEVVVCGAGQGIAAVRGYAGARHPTRIRRVAVITDQNIPDTTRANALAADEMRRRVSLLTIGEIVVSASHSNAPMGSFSVGDDIIVQAEISYLGSVTIQHRIIGYTWMPDADAVTIHLERSEAFVYGRRLPRSWSTPLVHG